MRASLFQLILSATLGLSAFSVSAATYNVDEIFTGTSEFIPNSANGTFVDLHHLALYGLVSGDTALFSSTLESVVTGTYSGNGVATNITSFCNSGCSFTETLKNGDAIFGSFSFTDFYSASDGLYYSGNTTISSGTGLFAGVVGSGNFSGVDYFNGTTVHRSIVEMTTPTVTAVPEPETYALFLAGLGLIGLVARRNDYI